MDLQILSFLETIRTPFWDAFFSAVSICAQQTAVLTVMLLFYWCVNKKTGLRIGIVYFAAGIVGQFAKILFRVERPFVRDNTLTPYEGAIKGATGYSFPSGHTVSASSLACSLVQSKRKNKYLLVGSVVYVLLVAFSRLYLGVHTPQDVLCAIVISVIMAIIADFAIKQTEQNPKAAAGWLTVCGISAAAILVYAAVSVKTGMIPEHQAADAFKTAGAVFAFILGMILDNKYIHFSTEAPLIYQILKIVLGGAITLGLLEGLKPVLGSSLPMSCLRYFITVFFVTAGWPCVFTAVLKKMPEKKSDGADR